MPSRRDQITRVLPGAGGVITDTPRIELPPDATDYGRDYLIRANCIEERGGYASNVYEDPFGSSEAIIGHRFFKAQNAEQLLVVTADDGRVAIIDGVTPTEITTLLPTAYVDTSSGARYYPREVAEGEVLLCHEDGTYPILRTSGAVAPGTAPTGTLTYNADAKIIQRITGTWAAGSWPDQGVYLGYGALGPHIRTAGGEQGDYVALKTPAPYTQAAVPTAIYLLGVIAYGAEVPAIGQVTISATTAVAGYGTQWSDLAVADGGILAGVDRINTPANDTGYWSIASVGSNTGMTAGTAMTNEAAPVTYQLSRPMPGKDAAIWQGRLATVGIPWTPRRVYLSPPGYDLSDPHNGIDSSTSAVGDAILAKFIDIPSPGYRGGAFVACGPTTAGLLVVGLDELWLLRGEYPNLDIEPVSDTYGAARTTAVFRYENRVYGAGARGIWMFDGQTGLTVLTEGDGRARSREWRRTTEESSRGDQIAVGADDDHLLVATNPVNADDNNDAPVWCFDLQRGVWTGNMTLPGGIKQFTIPDRDELDGGGEFTIPLYASGQGDSLASVGSIFITERSDTGDAVPNPHNSANPGVLKVRVVPPATRQVGIKARVTRIKATYALQAASANAQWAQAEELKFDGYAATLPTTTDREGEAHYMPPNTSGGASTTPMTLDRQFAPILTRTENDGDGDPPGWFRVYAIDFFTRLRRASV